MADKKIYQLTNDTAVNIANNDLFPVSKYISPGTYTTVYKSGLNITSLPTASFANIDNSINAVQPAMYAAEKLKTVKTKTRTLTTGELLKTIVVEDVVISPLIDRIFTCHVKLFANGFGGRLAVGEYIVVGSTNIAISGNETSLQRTILYEYETAGIILNSAEPSTPNGINFNGSTGNYNLIIYVSNSSGADVNFTCVVKTYMV